MLPCFHRGGVRRSPIAHLLSAARWTHQGHQNTSQRVSSVISAKRVYSTAMRFEGFLFFVSMSQRAVSHMLTASMWEWLFPVCPLEPDCKHRFQNITCCEFTWLQTAYFTFGSSCPRVLKGEVFVVRAEGFQNWAARSNTPC